MYPLNNFDVTMSLPHNKTAMILNTFCLIENKKIEDLSLYIKNNILKNIEYSIPHSCKIVDGFFKNENPYFIFDKNFNINNHVFTYDSNKINSLEDFVQSIYNKEIDMTKPLWEVHIINNYDKNGNTAIIRRFHHSAIEGELNAKMMNIIFDEFIPFTKKVKKHKINAFNCSLSIIKRYLLMIYFFCKGFLIKSNKVKNNDLSEIVFRIKNLDEQKDQKIYDSKIIPYKNIYNIINNSKYSLLDVCIYLFSKSYSTWANLNDINIDRTVNIIIPMSTESKNKRMYGNNVMGAFVNIHLNEKDDLVRLEKISNSIKNAIGIKKTSPFSYYASGIQNYPKKNGILKAFNLMYKTSWNNRKKIPIKKDKSTQYSASVSVKKILKSNNDYTLSGNRVIQVNTFPPIIKSKYTLGINAMFRVDKEDLICSVTAFKNVFPDPKLFINIIEKELSNIKYVISL